MTGERREWLAAQPLAVAARERVTVELEMLDALERQMALLGVELRLDATSGTSTRYVKALLVEPSAARQRSRDTVGDAAVSGDHERSEDPRNLRRPNLFRRRAVRESETMREPAIA